MAGPIDLPQTHPVVLVLGLAAALSTAAGYVLQQRVAGHALGSSRQSYRLVWELMHKRVWWAGLGCMIIGQVLGGLALSRGSVALVEPLLSTTLVFAFVIAAFGSRQRIRLYDIAGALLVCTALGLFIALGHPHDSVGSAVLGASRGSAFWTALGVTTIAVLLLITIGRRHGRVVESIMLASAAGALYGLQDAGTRAVLVQVEQHGTAAALTSAWTYVVLVAGGVGLVLSQAAFRSARLDYSLPPIAVAEPLVGILLGVTLLGDVVSLSTLGLAVDAGCVVAMVVGVILIGRSASLAHCPMMARAEAACPLLAGAETACPEVAEPGMAEPRPGLGEDAELVSAD
jgi:drug/metabolite transporter (DMT)-like permease